MSNSSDWIPGAESESLSAILAAMAGELVRTAADVEKLGESLSGNIGKPENLRKNFEMQTFDLLTQAVQAQARLLAKLSELGRDVKSTEIAVMIEDVPFSPVRQRLLAAVNGASVEDAYHPPDESEVSWF